MPTRKQLAARRPVTTIGMAIISAVLMSTTPALADQASDKTNQLLNSLDKADILTQPDIVRDIEALGGGAVPTLIDVMNTGNARQRHQVIEIIGRIGQDAQAATPHLIESLTDVEAQIRRNAAWALGRVGENASDAMPTLLDTATDIQWDVRADAVWAMGKVVEDTGEWGAVDADLVEAVKGYLGDENHHVRWSAAWSLARFGPGAEAAIEALAEALSDYHPKVRASAASALGEVAASHHEDLIGEALKKAMNDESPLVRVRAEGALEALRRRVVPGS